MRKSRLISDMVWYGPWFTSTLLQSSLRPSVAGIRVGFTPLCRSEYAYWMIGE